MDIANRFKLFKIRYGYKTEEHIQGERDDKNGHLKDEAISLSVEYREEEDDEQEEISIEIQED